ncbi:variant leucine-rich repeat-containing protein [Streptacidiphilus sp. PAMC 29251]
MVTVGGLPHSAQLCRLAENPALPPDLLDRFIAVADPELCVDLAERDDLTPGQAHRLAVRGGGSQVAFALIAGGRIPLADVPRYGQDAGVGVARRSDLTPAHIEGLARHPDPEVRQEIAERDDLPAVLLLLLARDPEVAVACAVAEHRALPAESARQLAAHPDQVVRAALAHNPAVPPEVLAALLADGGGSPLSCCGVCRQLPDEAERRERCGDHRAGIVVIQAAALGNPSTPSAGLERFVDFPDLWGRADLAQRPDLPEPLQRRLAADPQPQVRAALAENPVLAPALIQLLADDPEPRVRRAAALNPSFPLPLLERSAPADRLGPAPLPRILAASEEELRRLAMSPTAQVRAMVADRRNLPADLLARLAADPDPGVAKRIAPDPDLDPDQMRALAERHGPRLYAALARNPHCPAGLLHRMALGAAPVTKALRAIARHPAATPETLLLCLSDPQGGPAAAAHPALPGPVLAGLMDDPRSQVRCAAAANPSLPVSAMRALLAPRDAR